MADYTNPYAPPDFDLSDKLPKIVDSYWSGLSQEYTQRNRDAFKDGLPTDAQGNPDWGKIAQTLLKTGGAQGFKEAASAANLDLQQKQLQLGQQAAGALAGTESPTGQSPVSLPTIPQSQPAPQQQPTQGGSSRPVSDNGVNTVASVLGGRLGDDNAGPAIVETSKALGVDPNAPLNLQDPRTRQTLGQAILKYGGGQPLAGTPQQQPVPPSTGPGPQATQPPTQTAQAAPAQRAAGPLAPPAQAYGVAPGAQQPTGVDPNIQQQISRLTAIMGNPALPQPVRDAAKMRLENLQKQAELTNGQKEYDLARRQGYQGSYEQFQADQEQGKAVAAAKGKRMAEVIEAGGRSARGTLNTLNVMDDALDRAGNNISTGPGASFFLKVKEAAKNIFPDLDLKGLSEGETITKLNAQLAAQAAKAMTARPSQLEFRAFMANNPGLQTSIQGTKALINIMRQTTQQDIALSRLASQPQNMRNWDAVEDQFYQQNPIKSPFTGKPLTGKESIPGMQQGSATQNTGGLPTFSSPDDVRAAVKAGKAQKGDTFLDPNGVRRVIP